MRASRAKSAAKRLGLLLAGLASGLIAAEVCLRLLGVSYPLPYAPDAFCGTRLQPGFRGWWRKEGAAWIQINRYGFRHGDRTPTKPPGTFRIAVLGDSYVEGFQVPDDKTFCAVLEKDLNRRRASPGCANHGAGDLRLLRQTGSAPWIQPPPAGRMRR